MARSGCSTAVASMSEGDRLRVWHGRVDRITLLLGQFSELVVGAERHGTVFVIRAKQVMASTPVRWF